MARTVASKTVRAVRVPKAQTKVHVVRHGAKKVAVKTRKNYRIW